MDFNTVMQTVLTLMVGALCWFIQRSVKKLDDGIAKLDERITKINERIAKEKRDCDDKIDKLKDEFQSFQKDMPLVYTLREDFLRIMNGVDDKLNKILYGRNGGSGNE